MNIETKQINGEEVLLVESGQNLSNGSLEGLISKFRLVYPTLTIIATTTTGGIQISKPEKEIPKALKFQACICEDGEISVFVIDDDTYCLFDPKKYDLNKAKELIERLKPFLRIDETVFVGFDGITWIKI